MRQSCALSLILHPLTDCGISTCDQGNAVDLADSYRRVACTVTTGRMIRQSPDMVRSMVKAMAEAVHYYKTQKEDAIKIMQKYTRGQNRAAIEGTYTAYRELLVEDVYPILEGLKNTLEIQVSFDPKAAKAKVDDFVDVRFVDELRKTGFIDSLYNREQTR